MDSPYPLETIVQRCLMLKGDRVPNVDNIVFPSRQYDWEVGVETDRRYVVCVTLVEGEKTLFREVVPDFHMAIISSRYQVRAVKRCAEVKAVDTCLVADERVVGRGFG